MVSLLLFAAGCRPRTAAPPVPTAKPQAKLRPSPAIPAAAGADIEVAQPIAVPLQQDFPELTPGQVDLWVAAQNRRSPWWSYKNLVSDQLLVEMAGGQAKRDLVKAMAAELRDESVPTEFLAIAETIPFRGSLSVHRLGTVLKAMEEAAFFDPWLVAYLFGLSDGAQGDAKQLAELYGRMENHIRIAESMVLAHRQAEMLRPRPWLSKAAPPKSWPSPTPSDPAAMLADARKMYPERDAGTWESGGLIAVRISGGQGSLRRRGKARSVGEAPFHLRRLDVLVADSDLELHLPFLGFVQIREGTMITSLSLWDHLDDAMRAKARELIEEAKAGDAAALDRIKRLFPAIHPAVRESLSNEPSDVGAGLLRSLVFEYDW